MPTMNEMRENQTGLRRKLDAQLQTGLALANKPDVTMKELEDSNAQVNLMRAQLEAVTAALKDAEGGAPKPDDKKPADNVGEKVKARLKTPEYARAFVRGVSMGLRPNQPCPGDSLQTLYDALTEAGGTPAGEDGGFLVPEDVNTQINELIRQQDPLRALVTVETTTTSRGTRVVDNAPTKGLAQIDGELPAAGIPQDDQPMFRQITYTLASYGLLLPVSRELLADNTANLMAYIARWYAKKQLITENDIIKANLMLMTAQNIRPEDDKNAILQLRSLLNLALDPAISLRATILTNQDGFDYLDSLTDSTGRPLLSQDTMTGSYMLLKTRPVHVVSNANLPSRVVTATGATKGEYYPLYVGDFTQYMTLFVRDGLEFASTDVGAGSFEKNGVMFRGLTRLGGMRVDTDAAVRREIFIAG
jgi:HK97 family phage major capsid protein